jgi:hypothetical protein
MIPIGEPILLSGEIIIYIYMNGSVIVCYSARSLSYDRTWFTLWIIDMLRSLLAQKSKKERNAEYSRRRKLEERVEYTRLQLMIPTLEVGTSKIQTLRCTVKYIEGLQNHLIEMDRKLQRLYRQSLVDEEAMEGDGEEILGM